jgi:O-methyltransferase involved in polyketide biosynthesis
VLNDTSAIEIVEHIDYDFSMLDKKLPFESNVVLVARAKQFDDKIRASITKYPHASVINLGADLDTTFYHIDNGLVRWYGLDLLQSLNCEKKLIPETDRAWRIAKSLLDLSWCKDIENVENGVLMISCGVLAFFEESQVKQLFSSLANNLPDVKLYLMPHQS